jgi:hypothetical protein
MGLVGHSWLVVGLDIPKDFFTNIKISKPNIFSDIFRILFVMTGVI